VYETWGFSGKGRRGLGVSVLFAGESGTGKTMAAEVLAGELELDLYRIDLSAVVSKYLNSDPFLYTRIASPTYHTSSMLKIPCKINTLAYGVSLIRYRSSLWASLVLVYNIYTSPKKNEVPSNGLRERAYSGIGLILQGIPSEFCHRGAKRPILVYKKRLEFRFKLPKSESVAVFRLILMFV